MFAIHLEDYADRTGYDDQACQFVFIIININDYSIIRWGNEQLLARFVILLDGILLGQVRDRKQYIVVRTNFIMNGC